MVADKLDPERLNDLFEIGIDEVSWRKQHNYLTLVSNHHTGKVVWGAGFTLRGVERHASVRRQGGQEVQGRALVADEEPKQPHRQAVGDLASSQAARRGSMARLPAQGVVPGDLDPGEVEELLDRLISQAQRSQLEPFVKLAKTLRENRDGILAAIRLGVNNGRAEGLNNVVRLVARRAYGFLSAAAAVALVMLCCGPITLRFPYQGLL